MKILNNYYDKFVELLKKEDKEESFKFAMGLLKEISVIELYENILAPSLNSVIDEFGNDSKELI